MSAQGRAESHRDRPKDVKKATAGARERRERKEAPPSEGRKAPAAAREGRRAPPRSGGPSAQ